MAFITEDRLEFSVVLDTTAVPVGTELIVPGRLLQGPWRVPGCPSPKAVRQEISPTSAGPGVRSGGLYRAVFDTV